ncbi:MAG: hypothetical protein Q8Q62_13365 [Mesorhizobium sp.]|nr:hypothetical protein [Mesorhizobium sp.]
MLVVAADDGFRRSLVFALEAEGFDVAPYSGLEPAMAALAGTPASCVVVDEDALRERDEWNGLMRSGRSVILLIDAAAPPPGADNLAVLRKPVFGNKLVESIASLTGRSS